MRVQEFVSRGLYEAALSEFDVPDIDRNSINTLQKSNGRTSSLKLDFLISKKLSCPRNDETSGRDDYRYHQSSLKPFDSRSFFWLQKRREGEMEEDRKVS